MPVTAAPNRQNFWLQYLSLFSSLGTLLCCALPSLLVLFGLGATVGSLLTAVPWLVSLSHHKNWVFTVAGVLIGANVLYVHVVAPRLRVRPLPASSAMIPAPEPPISALSFCGFRSRFTLSGFSWPMCWGRLLRGSTDRVRTSGC